MVLPTYPVPGGIRNVTCVSVCQAGLVHDVTNPNSFSLQTPALQC